MTKPEDWRGWDRETLSAAYNNSAAVAGSAATVAGWAADSKALRTARPAGLDKPYGATQREGWDLFPAADPAAPCLVFIHGGYWQRNAREGFSCIVEGALAKGWSAALPGYAIAPDASLTEITAQLRSAMDWLQAHGAANGIAGPVIVSGWSAGGHLAAMMADHPLVRGVLAISGVFDLAPIQGTALNDALSLTQAELLALSPQKLPLSATPIAVAYGGAELPELQRQSREFHALRAAAGAPGPLLPVPGADHFTILAELRAPGGSLLAAAEALLHG
ncbi:acetyl esterase/lipase [Humitalea rosea]|uniref:Acetyl esterase/lipase n=1 Tax=Humitalea rosea TaxID=990373 RepID=A0A2W7ITB5_9PROT|nr:alpha/beta hydrolase [Humitalea rosea]PZW50499.1 acetyl esterase/lipase [Humitalea rosea]